MINAVNAAGTVILVLNDAGLIVEATPAAAGFLGYDRAELLGMAVPAFLAVASLSDLQDRKSVV